MEEVRGCLGCWGGGTLERAGLFQADPYWPALTCPGAEDRGQQPGQGAGQPQCLSLRLWGWGWRPYSDHAGPPEAPEQYGRSAQVRPGLGCHSAPSWALARSPAFPQTWGPPLLWTLSCSNPRPWVPSNFHPEVGGKLKVVRAPAHQREKLSYSLQGWHCVEGELSGVAPVCRGWILFLLWGGRRGSHVVSKTGTPRLVVSSGCSSLLQGSSSRHWRVAPGSCARGSGSSSWSCTMAPTPPTPRSGIGCRAMQGCVALICRGSENAAGDRAQARRRRGSCSGKFGGEKSKSWVDHKSVEEAVSLKKEVWASRKRGKAFEAGHLPGGLFTRPLGSPQGF